MNRSHQLPTIRFHKKVRYDEQFDEYTLQLRHVHRPWWLLLLLLPLLLFIKCSKDVEVRCLEMPGDVPVAGIPVTMAYEAHSLWSGGRFFATDSVQRVQHTDASGTVVFRDLPCSVFSYVFYGLSQASFTAVSKCHAAVDEKHNFHYRRHIVLDMPPRREDLYVRLADKEVGDALPDAMLIYTYVERGKEVTDSVQADADGVATLPQMRYCSVLKEIKGVCYGYADTSRVNVPCQHLIQVHDSTTLRLRPLKERFTFFVKNKETKQPIPDATCLVTLTHPGSSKKTLSRTVRTSIDGKGVAVYDNAFVLSSIDISAGKLHFKDGKLEGPSLTVEAFNRQVDSLRTVWLEPEPYLQEFVNLDSITGTPLPGVKNRIRVKASDGTVTTSTEMSNSNGVFTVSAKEDDRVEILSAKRPEYKDKTTRFAKFKDITEQDKEIRMQPIMETLSFRTVWKERSGALLPDCNLRVTGSVSGSLLPTNSGNGEFAVTMRKYESLSIAASKKGYVTNNTKVKDRNWDYLQADPERRDIPLKLDLPPCSGGVNTPKQDGEMYHQRSYGMGQERGNASISGDFYGEPDFLTVYDGVGTSGAVLVGPDRPTGNEFNIPFHFTQGAVTVVIRTSTNDGSTWEYVVNCPQ